MMSYAVGVHLALCVLYCFVSNAALAPTKADCDLPKEVVEEITEVFEVFDEDGDGKITVDEFREVMIKFGEKPTEEGLKTIIAALDKDESGAIEFDEFLGFMEADIKAAEERMKNTFKLFDRNGNGKITHDELRPFLVVDAPEPSSSLINRLVKELEDNPQGVVTYEVFKNIVKSLE